MEHVDVLIIGAGISGIGTACHLKLEQPGKRFVMLEGRARIGGTWDLFRYPGVRSDSDMFTFGYDFKPWVQEDDIATGDAILAYLEETIDEFNLAPHMRFGHHVECMSWSSEEQRWLVEGTHNGEPFAMSANVLVTCTGYYRYERGFVPEFKGMDDFKGLIVEPQLWPEDLDYTGKRVIVIGSGATAVTMVPAMAKKAAHVTMLQRSPSYVLSRPARDAIAQGLRAILPERVAYTLARLKSMTLQSYLYAYSRARPGAMREYLLRKTRDEVGEGVDVDTHFNPEYEPWDQRMCMIPDADLFTALRAGDASVVTDSVDHFTATGVKLKGGEHIEADIVVPATGLELQFLGGMVMKIDGQEIALNELVCYRGMMFGGVPNAVSMFGYTSSSWTLKTDLSGTFLCRLLNFMDTHDYGVFTPHLADPNMPTQSILTNLSSATYVKRCDHRLPRQGTSLPWRNQDSYFSDFFHIRFGRIKDDVLRFTRRAR